jgi:hypothetical protein
MTEWPEWWEWEPEISSHVLKRMADRDFNEIDLRLMLERATGYHADVEEGRWVIETSQAGRAWEIVVEPQPDDKVLVVITAYLLL